MPAGPAGLPVLNLFLSLSLLLSMFLHLSPRLRRLIAFILVGASAAAVHLGVVVALVSQLGLHPLQANVAGWAVAFLVSYGGHRWQTFRDSHAPAGQSLPRFFLISAAGFIVNEAAYALLLRHAGAPYPVALALVLVGVAVLTYLTSRHWAFRHKPA